MFLNSLLEVSEKTTDIVTYIIIGALALLAVIVVTICIVNRGKKKFDTKSLAYAAVCLATSFVLSFIKIAPVPNGGSITLASWVPVLVFAYAYGAAKGFLVGIIFGILNFLSGPYILTPFTFLLDYILAFAMIGLMGFARHFGKSLLFNVLVGTGIAVFARFWMHLFSGMIYFAEDAIWVDLPTPNAFVYSLIYQLVYIPGDALIILLTFVALVKTGVLQTLLHMMRPAAFPVAKQAAAPVQGVVDGTHTALFAPSAQDAADEAPANEPAQGDADGPAAQEPEQK